MKRFKKVNYILIVCLIIMVSFQCTSPVKAVSMLSAHIVTSKIPSEAINFAAKEFPKHKGALMRSKDKYDFQLNKVEKFSLGTPFSVFSYNDNNVSQSDIYHFPVLENSKIVALFSVTKTKDNSFTATLSKSFASELEQLVKSNESKNFRLYDIEDNIIAADKSTFVTLSENKVNNKKTVIDSLKIKKINESANKNMSSKKYKEDKVSLYNQSSEVINYSNPDAPIDYAYLGVPIVLQGSHPWCWAATCASIINYIKGESLSAGTVVQKVYGSQVDQGGGWTEIKKAYNSWGLYPYQTSYMTYSQTKSYLKGYYPIHARMFAATEAHSMTLRGFEEYDNSSNLYLLIDPNKSYYVSVTAYNNGNNVYYIMNNKAFYWNYSILGW